MSSALLRRKAAAARRLEEPVLSLDPTEHADADALRMRLADSKSRAEGQEVSDEEEAFPEVESMFEDSELLVTKTPLLTGSDPVEKREEIRAYFHKTFSLYERLFDVLASEDTFRLQPEMLRHPLIFYFGHTAVFFVNKLRLAGLLQGRINAHLESTLAIGVDEMSWDDLNTGNYVWPTVGQVRAYRDLARVVVDDLISSLPLTLPITWQSPFWVILMGCEHERIHLETSSVLFRQLPLDQVRPMPMWEPFAQFRARAEDAPLNALLPVPGGLVTAGNSQATQQYYGWDLEYGTHSAEVSPFHAARFLASNAEFLAFVLAGGYEDPTLWGEEGWKFVEFRRARHPVFWVPVEEEEETGDAIVDGSKLEGSSGETDAPSPRSPSARPTKFLYRSMTRCIPMPWDWPVDVNYIEARAFCAWKNRQRAAKGEDGDGLVYRMPSEDEYRRMRDHAFPASQVDPESGAIRRNDQPFWSVAPGQINLEHGASSCPVDRHAFLHGFHDVVGNVWQWTETPLMPFKGFAFHPLYDDFSVPTFDTRHNVFAGGSWASTGNEATRMARFAFRRHFYQHAGFRYVLAAPLQAEQNQVLCETDEAVVAMMEAQFNDGAARKLARNMRMQPQPNYAEQVARIAVEAYKNFGTTGTPLVAESDDATPTSLTSEGPRAFDLGCACGRSTFELAKLSAPSASGAPALFNHILGLDMSTRFVRVAAQLQFQGHAEYAMRKEGSLLSYHSIESAAGAVAPLAPLADEAAQPGPVDVTVSTEPSVLDLDLKSRRMQHRVEFLQGDASNLASKYTGFDLVLASNLLEFLYAPRAFLASIGARVRTGGILVLASTYEWSESYTPRECWMGGHKDGTGESVESARAVAEVLSQDFTPLPQASTELPMIWKHNARNFNLRFAHVTVWKKK